MKHTILALALISTAASPALAQNTSTGALKIELNKLVELAGGACRLTYVVDNNTNVDLKNTTYEMAIFNKTGIVSNMLLMEFGGIAAGKKRVVQFDVADQKCADVSHILVNNQIDCTTTDGTSTVCLDRLATKTLVEDLEFTH